MPVISENNTGPYRRVLSKTGFAYEAATIFLPGSMDITTLDASGQIKPSGDTVYVYLGGSGTNGGEVDAGFQYSAKNKNWSLFMAVSGFGYTYGPTPGAPAHTRFKAEQTVTLEFEVISANVLEVRATGVDVTGAQVTHAIQVDASTYPESNANVDADLAGEPTKFGWNPTGGGNRLKRVTSIGQNRGHEDYHSGSFVQNVQWSGCVIGKTKASAVIWSAANTSSFNSYPSKELVAVDYVSQAGETVSIDL